MPRALSSSAAAQCRWLCGLLNAGGTMNVIDCTLRGNQALGGFTDAGPGGLAEGGGIDNWGPTITGTPGILTVLHSTLTGNKAVAGHGGPGTSATFAGFAAGGGINDGSGGRRMSGIRH
jgi:hypothetical protein